MHQTNGSRLDLNLLPIFVALMREGSVTAAAASLDMSQPAVSHALQRLRNLLADALLVRSGRGLMPTTRALELLAALAPALSAIEGGIRKRPTFSPGDAGTTFKLGLADDLQIALLPGVLDLLRRHAPTARLIVRTTDYKRAAGMLASGEVSVVAGYLDALPAQAKTRTLRQTSYRVLRDKGRRRRLSLASYCAADHVLVTFAGDLRGYIDETLEALGVARTITLSLPQFSSLPYVLGGTALLATVPDFVAQALAKRHELANDALPFASPTFSHAMAWRAEVDADPAEMWFRDILLQAFKGMSAGQAKSRGAAPSPRKRA